MAIQILTTVKSSLTVDGTTSGYAVVASNAEYVIGAIAYLASATVLPTEVIITDLSGTDKVGVRFTSVTHSFGHSDLSAFKVADSATITMPAPQIVGGIYQLDGNNERIIHVEDPVALTDAATKEYVDAAVGAVAGLNPMTAPSTISAAATQTLILEGRAVDGAGAIGVKVGNVNSLVTSGAQVVAFYSDLLTTKVGYVDYQGSYGSASGVFKSTASVSAKLLGNVADGGSAVGTILDNAVTLSTSGAKLLSVRNNTVEKFYVDKDGNLGISGSLALPAASIQSKSLTLSATTTLYVDGATGSDSNDGSIGSPFATIQACLDYLPSCIRGAVTINVAAGTYAPFTINKNIENDQGSLTITGTSFLVPVLVGQTSGTIASATPLARTYTVTGATWAVNELSRKWLKITSGSLSGRYYPIISNTASTITMAYGGYGTGFTSQTFEIYDMGVTISRSSGPSYAINVMGNNIPFQSNVVISNMNISSNSNGIIVGNSGVVLTQLMVNDSINSGATLRAGGIAGVLSVNRCFFYQSVASQIAIRAISSCANNITLNDCVIHGYTAGFRGGSIELRINQSTIENCGTYGVFLEQRSWLKLNLATLTGNGWGVWADGFSDILASTSGIYNSTNDGVLLGHFCSFYHDGSGGASVGAGITDSGGFGIKTNTKATSFVKIRVATSNETISTNTSGDFTLDGGTTAISYATLQADPDKTITDPVYLVFLQSN